MTRGNRTRSSSSPERAAAIKANPLVKAGIATRPVHSIITNSTYDGLCYNAKRVQELLDPSVDRIHFDEAWYAYARFNPLYRDRHAMHGDPKDHKGPTIFATHSTHKLLAALSQASFLHIRDGRSPIPHCSEQYGQWVSTAEGVGSVVAGVTLMRAIMRQECYAARPVRVTRARTRPQAAPERAVRWPQPVDIQDVTDGQRRTSRLTT